MGDGGHSPDRRIPGCPQDLDVGRARLGSRHQHGARKRNCRMSAAIELRGVEKSFGNVAIIRSINLSVAQGERHALIGPNGAGKSTTFNLISGYMAPSSGSVLLRGQVISGLPPYQINRRALSRSFQVPNVFANMSVWQTPRCALLWPTGFRGGCTARSVPRERRKKGAAIRRSRKPASARRRRDAGSPGFTRLLRQEPYPAGGRYAYRRRRGREPAGAQWRRTLHDGQGHHGRGAAAGLDQIQGRRHRRVAELPHRASGTGLRSGASRYLPRPDGAAKPDAWHQGYQAFGQVAARGYAEDVSHPRTEGGDASRRTVGRREADADCVPHAYGRP